MEGRRRQAIHARPDLMSRINPTSRSGDHHQQVWAVARPPTYFGAGLCAWRTAFFSRAIDVVPLRNVYSFCRSHQRLWVGTEGGLGRWDGSQVRIVTRRRPFGQ